MLDFHVFVLACSTKLQNYKHINFQFAGIASYKLQNYNLGYRPMTKFASLQNQNIYKLVITNLQIAKLQVYKLHVYICKFQIYKIKTFS
jgi:hypothetical protein